MPYRPTLAAETDRKAPSVSSQDAWKEPAGYHVAMPGIFLNSHVDVAMWGIFRNSLWL